MLDSSIVALLSLFTVGTGMALNSDRAFVPMLEIVERAKHLMSPLKRAASASLKQALLFES